MPDEPRADPAMPREDAAKPSRGCDDDRLLAYVLGFGDDPELAEIALEEKYRFLDYGDAMLIL